jgi:hypothetical protein
MVAFVKCGKYLKTKFLGLGIALGLLFLFATSSLPTTSAAKNTQYTGYQVTGPYTTLRVWGTWIVPTANCTKTPNSVSNLSVVIDGISGEGDAMMIGTYQDCVNGVAHYGAFLNVYPVTSFYGNKTGIDKLVIHPGDVVEAQGTWRYPRKPLDWNTNFVDLTTKVILDTDAYTPKNFTPRDNSGAIILSSDGGTLTSLTTITTGREYTHVSCSDVTGPEHVCNTFGKTSRMSNYTLIKWEIPGTTLGILSDAGSSFEIENG